MTAEGTAPAPGGKDAPLKDVPGGDVPGEDAPGKDGPPEEVPTETVATDEADSPVPADDTTPWHRLDARMIWADALKVLLSLTPAAIALLVVRVEPSGGTVWPVIGIAVWGTLGAGADVLRWITTRYRVTEDYVERRTGLFVKTYRSIRRDRIRSVDADAKLLQRMVGLRRVKVGAGQVNTAGESALVLNAVSKPAAVELHDRLLGGRYRRAAAAEAAVSSGHAEAAEGAESAESAESAAGSDAEPREQVFSGLRWWWVFYNMFSIWAFFMAAGLLWGGYFMLTMFGADPTGWLSSLADWESIGTFWTVVAAVAATWVVGVIGLSWNFFAEHANFKLVRLPGENGTLLRTTQGLLKTREVNRDDNRLRGLSLGEPLLWRWMRMTDTSVITTGLSMWSASAIILPRGPRSVARTVTGAVLQTPESPLEAPLRDHPRAALRRRMVWALLFTASVTGLLGWITATTSLPTQVWWITGSVLLPVSIGLGWVGHRSLGHTFSDGGDPDSAAGGYVVVRSGATSRSTTALQTRAVSGVRIRQSLFQRRLGLATVALSTAAGWGGYSAKDMAQEEAADFADRALPGGLVAGFRDDADAAAGPARG